MLFTRKFTALNIYTIELYLHIDFQFENNIIN